MRFYGDFVYFLPEDFVMNKRVKRPPDNPINALISFGNTLLYTKTIAAIYQTHLDADYEELPQTPYRFSMWQYSSTGSVPGIEGNVDLNIQLPKK